MIVVKVEKWPGGRHDEATVLGVMCIENMGQVGKDFDQTEYAVELQSSSPHYLRRGRLVHWRRQGWLTLVRKAFEGVD